MNRREVERILGAIREARRAGQRVALATVVRVRGSAYRREGARILVREDRSYECLLSGGCLEPAVAEAAMQVIATGRPVVVQWDLAEDSVWSLGVGCSGAVDIYIERVANDRDTSEWLGILERADPAVLVRPLTAASGHLLVREEVLSGSLGDSVLDEQVSRIARARLHAAVAESGTEWAGDVELFFEVSAPPPQLIVFGAGADAEPLVRYAWDAGFATTVVDARDAFLIPARFPHATLVSSHFSSFAGRVRLTADAFVVIMNHHLERDRESLRFALDSDARYIGLLGPRTRFEKLRTTLEAEGFAANDAALARVRNPAGLALGAETPEEIAISILGEMLALRHGFDAGFLCGRTSSLHRPRSSSALARS